MESNSSCNVESGQKLKQNEDAEETKSHVNDNSIIYFDCKICQNTVSACKDQENVDPNSEPEICRNCKASQKVQNTDDTNNSILRAPNSKTSQPVAAAVPQEEFDAVNISPLTSNNGDNNNINGIGSSSSIASGPPADLRSPFSVGDSHTSAVSIKPPKTASSNYGVMHLYESHGVYDTELESLIKESNQKRIDKFYAGVDVIYKPNDRKVCTCVPLLCPAKVYYSVAAEKTCSMMLSSVLWSILTIAQYQSLQYSMPSINSKIYQEEDMLFIHTSIDFSQLQSPMILQPMK